MKSQADVVRLIDAQNEIVDYWLQIRGMQAAPTRSDIDPGALRAHLGSLSILELDSSGEQATFRLVGTQLRHLIGADMRGRNIDELPASLAALWRTGLDLGAQSTGPPKGIAELADSYHAWLRLPLRADPAESSPSLMLCHDIIRRKKPRASRPLFCLNPLTGRAAAA